MTLAALRPEVVSAPEFNAHEYLLRTDAEYRRKYQEMLTVRMWSLVEALAVKAGLSFNAETGEVEGLSAAEKKKIQDPNVLMGHTSGGPVKEARPKHAVIDQPLVPGDLISGVFVNPNLAVSSEAVTDDPRVQFGNNSPTDMAIAQAERELEVLGGVESDAIQARLNAQKTALEAGLNEAQADALAQIQAAEDAQAQAEAQAVAEAEAAEKAKADAEAAEAAAAQAAAEAEATDPGQATAEGDDPKAEAEPEAKKSKG